MKWIKFSEYNLPPQGLKIVCFRKGDLWVARRIRYQKKDYYISITYGGKSGASFTDIPEYWMQFDLPEEYTGYMKLEVDGELYTFDALELSHPDVHEEFAGELIEYTKQWMDDAF